MDELHRRVVRNIKTIAKAKKIPLSHLADRSAVTRSHLWAFLAGNESCTLTWLQKIAIGLDADVDDLLAKRKR